MKALDRFGWINYDFAIFFHQFTHAGHPHKIFVSISPTESDFQNVTNQFFFLTDLPPSLPPSSSAPMF